MVTKRIAPGLSTGAVPARGGTKRGGACNDDGSVAVAALARTTEPSTIAAMDKITLSCNMVASASPIRIRELACPWTLPPYPERRSPTTLPTGATRRKDSLPSSRRRRWCTCSTPSRCRCRSPSPAPRTAGVAP
ncbi:hypothetical protein GCM10007904_21300 [Oharaeibacter diazotrophicus]|nr:hypothetical protein GCM10007904_21300 [Oharaeibacter diazotrophicus]